jgi:drug/metabolite transporter (DMT)-like permease
VTVVAQVLGLPVLLLGVLLVPGHWHTTDLVWGLGAGLCGLLGIVLLYRGLATGAMAIVAPITGVTGAVVPLGVGLLAGEQPTTLALVGIVCAVVGIGLVSLVPHHPAAPAPRRRRSVVVGLSLAAGAMFGIFFALLAQAHDDAGLWPLAAVRLASIPVGLLWIARAGVGLRLPGRMLGWAALAGAGDVGANALFLISVRAGLLSVVAPIAALYPVSTVLLAVIVDRERVRGVQLVGLGFAATALVLTAV